MALVLLGSLCRLAVKRGKYQEADAFARELLMRRALAAWQEGVALRQEKRRYRGRQLAYAQEVLRCKKLTRLFTAWYDYHIGRVLKGLQVGEHLHTHTHTNHRALPLSCALNSFVYTHLPAIMR